MTALQVKKKKMSFVRHKEAAITSGFQHNTDFLQTYEHTVNILQTFQTSYIT